MKVGDRVKILDKPAVPNSGAIGTISYIDVVSLYTYTVTFDDNSNLTEENYMPSELIPFKANKFHITIGDRVEFDNPEHINNGDVGIVKDIFEGDATFVKVEFKDGRHTFAHIESLTKLANSVDAP